MARITAIAVLVLIAPLQACGESEPEPLPPIVQSFVDAHPELKLDLRGVEAAPDWAHGKRWRARLANGEQVIIYEQAGAIRSIRRADLSYLWDQ